VTVQRKLTTSVRETGKERDVSSSHFENFSQTFALASDVEALTPEVADRLMNVWSSP